MWQQLSKEGFLTSQTHLSKLLHNLQRAQFVATRPPKDRRRGPFLYFFNVAKANRWRRYLMRVHSQRERFYQKASKRQTLTDEVIEEVVGESVEEAELVNADKEDEIIDVVNFEESDKSSVDKYSHLDELTRRALTSPNEIPEKRLFDYHEEDPFGEKFKRVKTDIELERERIEALVEYGEGPVESGPRNDKVGSAYMRMKLELMKSRGQTGPLTTKKHLWKRQFIVLEDEKTGKKIFKRLPKRRRRDI